MSFRSIDLLNVRIWQSAECPFRRTLDVVNHALLFRNLACGQTKFRGHSGDCASMNKSSSHSLLQSAIKRATVSSQRVAVVTCEPAELLEYGHGMGVEIAIFGAFLCRERVLAGHQPSLVTRRSITGWISTVAFCKERSQHVRSFSW
jgi:hypothetical protein